MLCPHCRRQTERGAASCPNCGAPLDRTEEEYELVLEDRTRIPITHELSIGRGDGNGVRLADPSVSHRHAVVAPNGGGPPLVWDAGSSFGTAVDGRNLVAPRTLHDGARIEVGNSVLLVERVRRDDEPGRTVLVPAAASLLLTSPGDPAGRPRLHSGYALKRLESSEGSRRWVLKDLVHGRIVRLADDDAQLIPLLDGATDLPDLVRGAEARLGPAGPARLVRLLGDLRERGLLAGSDAPPEAVVPRLLAPRRWTWPGAGDAFERLYARGGWLLFTKPALVLIAATALSGVAAFAYLVAARYGTPFIVARKVGIGAIVFLAGRAAVAAVHETAHALTMSSFGRRVGVAGIKVVLIFPYVFVDTSDAWFEPRRRRIAVSAAGPVSDLTLGGAFALACFASPAGAVRDVLFQLTFGAYLGALFNLNPLLERDGYQILVDVLREPGLRRRALAQLRGRISGGAPPPQSRILGRYASFAVAWTVVAAATGTAVSLRYQPILARIVPGSGSWALLALVWAGMFAPPFAILASPLRDRVLRRRLKGSTIL
jgi:putative peptide zinc metalloprotease protein